MIRERDRGIWYTRRRSSNKNHISIYKCVVVDSVVPFHCPCRVVDSADRIMPILVV